MILLGFHAVGARIRRAAASIQTLYVDGERRDARMLELIRAAEQKGVSVHRVEAQRLDQFASGARHHGVVALAKAEPLARDLDELLDALKVPPLLLVLDGITDPRNLGACLRVADGAGVQAVVAPRDRSARLTEVAISAAAGAAESIPFLPVINLARTIGELRDREIRIVGAADEAEVSLFECDLTGPLAIVVGAEGEGMRRLTRERCDTLVRIPMSGAVESLNVSVAAGILLFEALRQRRGA
jgi:23S rRNA (guanosine2251-2'-O)-methyltransferase